ncbi:MAG: AGE family epimerase/isomerase [Armatimonadetes bacterium]|nr:AGE family epimerase/isomerase [Armatimonadota bacterium]
MSIRTSFRELLAFYQDHLTRQVMPFWTRHCIDREHGGINNVVADDGTLLSTDKVMWSQGRALWTFSVLYNEYDHNPDWLRVADNIARFVMDHGRDEKGAWIFRLARDGSVVEPAKSIYVDGFCTYGLTEYARASGSQRALDLCLETFRRTSPLLRDHATLPTAPLPIPPGVQAHGPSMLFSLVYHELGKLTGDREIRDRGLELADIVMTQHLKPERQVLLEFVRPGGAPAEGDVGKTFVPGHAIESMWFIERIYRERGRQEGVGLALDAIRWHLEKGWDAEYGGIFLARHTEGGAPAWLSPENKPWWCATEALYACLRAHELTGQPWCMEWYWRVHDYAFRTYPDREHGDWHQNLDRRGRIMPPLYKNMAVKDPYHLQRALIYAIHTLRNLAAREAGHDE